MVGRLGDWGHSCQLQSTVADTSLTYCKPESFHEKLEQLGLPQWPVVKTASSSAGQGLISGEGEGRGNSVPHASWCGQKRKDISASSKGLWASAFNIWTINSFLHCIRSQRTVNFSGSIRCILIVAVSVSNKMISSRDHSFFATHSPCRELFWKRNPLYFKRSGKPPCKSHDLYSKTFCLPSPLKSVVSASPPVVYWISFYQFDSLRMEFIGHGEQTFSPFSLAQWAWEEEWLSFRNPYSPL